MDQDTRQYHPSFSLLDRAACLRLHQAALTILRRTGVVVHHPAALDLLREAGASVEGDRARLSPSLVEWSLASAPEAFHLYGREGDEAAIHLDGRSSVFGPGSDTLHYLDPRTDSLRDFTLADLIDCYRVCDALPEIGFVMSVGIPRDVPEDRHYRHQFAAMLRHTAKPIVFVCDDLADIEAIAAMAAAVAGGGDALAERPILLLYSEPTSPLQHSREATDKLLFCSRHVIPITHSPAPMMGGTAPVTLAGAAALANAEILSSLVMHQLQNPGAPFLYGHGIHHLDMKDMVSVYGAPEFQLARVLAAEMGRFYRLPVWGYAGHTDSKRVDGQAAADAQFSVLVALLAGTNLNHDVGYLESGLGSSPELMVLTDEIIAQSRAFVDGIRIDGESLALDVIDSLGPGGDFLSSDHTLDHWRALWRPRLFDRQALQSWREAGSRDLNVRLKERTLALMDEHRAEPLPGPVEAELERVLRA